MRAIYVLLGLLLVCGMTALGQEVPDLMNYQGMLVDLGGTPVATGTYTLEFRIYDQISGGTLIWGPQLFDGVAETGHSDRVAVVEGAFSVILGPQDTTGRSLLEAFEGPNRFLEITVDVPAKALEILAPRQQILSAPYALGALTAKEAITAITAQTANSAAVESIDGSMIADEAVQPQHLADGTALAEILDDMGAGSGLDADLVDGKEASDFWQLGGNTGTTPGTDVLGTLDYTSMTFIVDGQQVLRFLPAPSPTLVGGYAANSAEEGLSGGVIAGGGDEGQPNKLGSDFSTVGGGYNNVAGPGTGAEPVLWELTNSDTVSGGNSNQASGGGSTVAGGVLNHAKGGASVIGGGFNNESSGTASAIGGGECHRVVGSYGSISGGGPTDFEQSPEEQIGNVVYDDYGTIGGGADNRAGSNDGATQDTTNAKFTTIGGGKNNSAAALSATVGGGQGNVASGDISTVGGGQGNEALAAYATISGGGPSDPAAPANTNNRVTDNYGVIGGGANNQAGDDAGSLEDAAYATVGGGAHNRAFGYGATIAGGYNCEASGNYSTIGGGGGHQVSGPSATVCGGGSNFATNDGAFVGGGILNVASGYMSTIGGGGDPSRYG